MNGLLARLLFLADAACQSSFVDAALTGVSATFVLNGSTIEVKVSGLAATTIDWGATYTATTRAWV